VALGEGRAEGRREELHLALRCFHVIKLYFGRYPQAFSCALPHFANKCLHLLRIGRHLEITTQRNWGG